ncbi:MAG: hypothetical protein JWM68_5787 [Verrucomicrobiales bacterium]|nr:hypothetical protein [Verrucomicrobiales bacterium]
MGGDQLIRSLQKIDASPFTAELNEQMEHVPFAGFHFYDLIFPLFVFMVGVAITFSVPRMIRRQGRGAAVKRIAIRSVILVLLGALYMGGVSNGFKNIYFAGVLQRIGVAYFFAALIFCLCRNVKALVLICIACLVGYWALMTFVPVPGLIAKGTGAPGFLPVYNFDFSHFNPPSCASGKSLAYAIDQVFMPGQKFEGTLLSTLGAIANALLGIFAGLLLQSQSVLPKMKSLWLVVAGVVSVELGFLWGLEFPIVKLLWTSSYVLVACGYSAILLGLFHQIIDVWGFKKWCQPFVWIGMNAITIYLISAVVGFPKVATRFIGADIAAALGSWADFTRAALALFFVFVVCRFLYRRQLFLRL